jgi:hypothetical protein
MMGTIDPDPEAIPLAPERELWLMIGHIEERSRAARVVARWKRYAAHHAPGNVEAQGLLSKVALEILCAVEEEPTDADT